MAEEKDVSRTQFRLVQSVEAPQSICPGQLGLQLGGLQMPDTQLPLKQLEFPVHAASLAQGEPQTEALTLQ